MNVLRRSVRRRAAGRLRRAGTRLLTLVAALVVVVPAFAALTAQPAAAAADDGTLRVLLFYKTNFHASHVQARAAVNELTQQLGQQYNQPVEIQETDQASAFTTANLANKDTVVFAQTGGVLFNAEQRSALEAYIRGGGGFVGLHYTGWSVGESEHDVNPFYKRLVGAVSEGHPENPGVRSGRAVVNDTAFPLAAGLSGEITRNDEWYDWVQNPAQNVRTIVSADESSYSSGGEIGHQGTNHPITWCQQIDTGRSWYTGMGHEGSAYSEPFMRTMIKNGIAYGAGLLEADCSPPAKDEHGSWSGVTPWPLMPINMALTSDGKVQSFGSIPLAGCTDNAPYDWSGNNCVAQGGQTEIDIWDPAVPRTLANLRSGILANTTYTDLFCSMQVQNPHTGSTMTVGGDDSLGANDPNDAAIGVTSYTTNQGLRNEAPMNIPRWYPTGTTMPDGSVVVQGGASRGGPGGPGVLTPEIYTPDTGNGWKLLTGATSAAAYGDGGNGNGPDENRWWYPRAFVAPGSGTLFNISGTQMFELDPAGNGGDGQMTLRGTLPTSIANQGGLGNPVGATSTAVMYAPGKILQVGGGTWSNGGGPAGARAAFTVDITGGTANPVVTAVDPMEFARHWATATLMPDGRVLVTGGSKDNNGNGGYVTTPEIWDPATGDWTTVEVPYERARLYHSTALLLPDGRVMIGGGGAPGPRNQTDVEYYSPSYLFDGDEPAVRPTITKAPAKIGYDGTFQVQTGANVSRVALVRNGSVTHGFNNDQNFQDLDFTTGSGSITVDAPQDGTYAPPGSYMLFVFDADGTPSVAKIVDIDPTVEMDQRTPQVVDQFEYPRLPAEWRSGTYPNTYDVTPGNGRMTPWVVDSQVQLVRGAAANQGGLGRTGYQLALGANGSMERPITGLDKGREYRISLRYARDSRVAGTADATATLSIGDLDATITATTANPSLSTNAITYGTYVGTFTASSRTEALELTGTANGVMVDDLVVIGEDPGVADVPIHYEFEEGAGSSAANTGTDDSVGAATLVGNTAWTPNGVLGGALDMVGGSNANTVDLPDNLLQDEEAFTTSFWVRPDTKGNWINLFHIGQGLGNDGSFFQIQMQTDARQGGSGLAATFKGTTTPAANQERVYATPTKDVVAGQWNHVVFTREGSTGTLYLNGAQIAQRTDLTIDMADVGPTTNNWLGRNGYVNDPSFDGRMDDVRLYTSALTASDVAGLYTDGTALNTTTTITANPVSPSPFAEPVTFSAAVAGPGAQPATGTAELWVDGALVGSPAAVTAGTVTFPAKALTRGDHAVEVRFTGAEGFRDSVGTATHTVQGPPPGSGVPIRYTFDEGTGTTAANSGLDQSIGAATLQGSTGWTATGVHGAGINLPGGASGTNNQVKLPDNIQAGMTDEFSISIWTRPDARPTWVPLVQIGSSTDTFFLLQANTQVNGGTGFAATFKKAGVAAQERLTLGGATDVPLNEWTNVVYTHSGTTGKIYFDGVLMGTRTDFTLDMGDVGVNGNTTANMIGGTSWPDARWDGLVDDFQMFGYALTEEQIDDLAEVPNSAPVGTADSYTTGAGEELEVAAPGVLSNDTDVDADTLTATGATEPANGSVTLAADGSFVYTPHAGFDGTDTFTYTATDGELSSAATTVTITVTPPPNTVPVATDDAYTTGEGEPLEVDAPGVLDNDTDAEESELTATSATQPDHGAVELDEDGSFVYTPDAGFFGTDSFTYRADDGDDLSAPATVTITVEEAPEETSVSATAAAVVYGRAGSVKVTVTPSTASGPVQVLKGGTVVGSGTVSGGAATVAIPARKLAPGTHQLTVRYAGNDTHLPSSTSVALTVRKASASMTVQAPKSVKVKAVPTLRVSLTAGGVPVTGKVTAKVGGKTVTGTVKGGKVTLKLAKPTKAGTLKVVVTYGGSSTVNPVSKTVTIKVTKR